MHVDPDGSPCVAEIWHFEEETSWCFRALRKPLVPMLRQSHRLETHSEAGSSDGPTAACAAEPHGRWATWPTR